MATDYSPLNNAATNLKALIEVQNADGVTAAKANGWEPFEVLAAKTIYNNYADIQANVNADVEGPASSTDNAVARFDGTTGKLIQNSLVTISDLGNLTVSGSSTVTGGNTIVSSTSSSAFPSFVSQNNNAGNAALQVGTSGSARGGTYFGASEANQSLIFSNGTSSTGLGIGTFNAKPLVLGTNNTAAISVNATTQAVTLSNNLTVSGTGTSSFAGFVSLSANTAAANALNVSNAALTGTSMFGNVIARFATNAANADCTLQLTDATLRNYYIGLNNGNLNFGSATGTSLMQLSTTGNLLIGGVIDNGNGNLQLKSTGGTSAGGIGFGADTSLFRSQAGVLALDTSGGFQGIDIRRNGTQNLAFYHNSSNGFINYLGTGSLTIQTTTGTAALTLDSSQNATFAGTVTVASSTPSLTLSGTSGKLLLTDTGVGSTSRNWAIGYSQAAEGDFVIRVSNAVGGDPIAGTTALGFDRTGAATFSGAVAIGNTVNTVSPTSPNRTITMVIGGTTYYIHAKTTND